MTTSIRTGLASRARAGFAASVLMGSATPLLAQPAAPPSPQPRSLVPTGIDLPHGEAHPVAPPSAEALKMARTLVDASGGGGMAAISGSNLPMAMLVKQLGIPPEHARAVIQEAIVPMLVEHSDDLSEIQAKSYASALSLDDLKQTVAFYQSPAGQKLVGARFQLLRSNVAGISELLGKLRPQIDAKVQETMKAHGWSKS